MTDWRSHVTDDFFALDFFALIFRNRSILAVDVLPKNRLSRFYPWYCSAIRGKYRRLFRLWLRRVPRWRSTEFEACQTKSDSVGELMFASGESRRTISLIGLIMLLLAVLGYVGLGIVLKLNGYPDNSLVRWTPIAVILRQHGHWLLVVPLIWAMYAVISSHIDCGLFSECVAFVVGIILIALILLLFLYAVGNPFSRPHLYYLPIRTSQTTIR